MDHYPVLIIGAGPTGMELAAELHRYNIDFLIVDKRPSHVTTSNAAGIHARTLECWHKRPWQKDFLEQGIKINGVSINSKINQLAHFDFTQLKHTEYPYILSLPQNKTEEILDNYLTKINKAVTRNTTFLDFVAADDHIIARLSTPNGEKKVTANWLIGCDGYHSTVREKAGINYSGNDIQERFLLVDAKFTANYAANEYHVFLDTKGITAFFAMGNSTRLIAGVGHDPEFKDVAEPTLDIMQKIIQERTNLKFKLNELLWQSHFWIHECIAEKFRLNRVFIAGDAAHVHSPAGGQGMNTGIQDVYNLAWKLACVIKQQAPATLLDTYDRERRPNAKTVVLTTAGMTRLANISHPLLLTIRNKIVPFATQYQLIQTLATTRLSQLSLKYKKSIFIQGKAIAAISPGQRALDSLIDSATNTFIYDLITDTKFHLLVFHADLAQQTTLTSAIKKYTDVLTVHYFNQSHGEILKTYRFNSFTLCLIRPDQYIAFIGTEIEEFKKVIGKYFLLT